MLDDPGLRQKLVAAGEQAVAPFDWDLIVADVLRVYELAVTGTTRAESEPRPLA